VEIVSSHEARDPDATWRVVPVYALTRGRTRSAGEEMPIEALVTANELADRHNPALQVEYREVLALVSGPVSVIEIGAALRVPAAVARVLVSDLANAGYLTMHLPPPAEPNGRPNAELLERLLDGLRSL
jgi:hypothetical protein